MKSPRMQYSRQPVPVVFLAATVAGCGARIVGGPGENTVAIGADVHGVLAPDDMRIVLPGRSMSTQYPTDTWTVDLTVGAPVTIAMCEDAGADIDPYLVIAMNGMDVHTNDDSAGGYHGHGSLVVFTPAFTGTYDLFASSYRPQLSTGGAYTLHVMAGANMSFRCPS